MLTLLFVATPILVACSNQSDSTQGQERIEVLLPELEFRSGVGFSPEKARTGLDDTLDSSNRIFKDKGSIEAITFDSISSASPKVAAVPPGDIVTTYGDMVPVVAVQQSDDVIVASAYGNNGICFFLEMQVSNEINSSLSFRKGVDFSITCNPFDYSDNTIWSTTDWPNESEVTMPNSPTPFTQGTPPPD